MKVVVILGREVPDPFINFIVSDKKKIITEIPYKSKNREFYYFIFSRIREKLNRNFLKDGFRIVDFLRIGKTI